MRVFHTHSHNEDGNAFICFLFSQKKKIKEKTNVLIFYSDMDLVRFAINEGEKKVYPWK